MELNYVKGPAPCSKNLIVCDDFRSRFWSGSCEARTTGPGHHSPISSKENPLGETSQCFAMAHLIAKRAGPASSLAGTTKKRVAPAAAEQRAAKKWVAELAPKSELVIGIPDEELASMSPVDQLVWRASKAATKARKEKRAELEPLCGDFGEWDSASERYNITEEAFIVAIEDAYRTAARAVLDQPAHVEAPPVRDVREAAYDKFWRTRHFAR